METVTDPWVSQYERLMKIIKKLNISEDLSPRIQKKQLILNRCLLSKQDFVDAISLFKYLYQGEV